MLEFTESFHVSPSDSALVQRGRLAACLTVCMESFLLPAMGVLGIELKLPLRLAASSLPPSHLAGLAPFLLMLKGSDYARVSDCVCMQVCGRLLTGH